MIYMRFNVKHVDRHRRLRGRKARWGPFINSGLFPYHSMRLRCDNLIVKAVEEHR